MKKKLVGIMCAQKWSLKVYEWYALYYGKGRGFRKVICFLLMAVSCITYPFRKPQKPDEEYIHEITDNGNIVKFYIPDYKTDAMQRYYLMTDNWHDHDFIGEFTRDYLKPDMEIVDVGGNIGNHTIYWALHASPRRIHTFEPNIHTFEILKRNIELNDLDNVVELNNSGVGSKEGFCNSVIVSVENSGSNQIKVDSDGSIPVVTIDSLGLEHLDFVKIDVEGMEYDVLLGGIETIKRFKPIILAEIFEENYKKVNDLLISMGYKKNDYKLLEWRHDYIYTSMY